jgi:hypothetical protein
MCVLHARLWRCRGGRLAAAAACPAGSAAGPPKIDLVDCVGMFCGACMYVGGVGQKELHCAPPLQRAMSLDEFGNGYI